MFIFGQRRVAIQAVGQTELVIHAVRQLVVHVRNPIAHEARAKLHMRTITRVTARFRAARDLEAGVDEPSAVILPKNSHTSSYRKAGFRIFLHGTLVVDAVRIKRLMDCLTHFSTRP